MSEVFDLFILEDNDAAYDSFNSLIEDYNKENEIKIKTVRFKEVKQALNAIKSGWYDGAIIDIRLSTSDDSENGNEIIREIKNNLRFPIRVYTGYDDIDDDLQDQNEFYKIYKRTDIRFQEVLVELINIYKTGITKILGKKGTIEDYLRDIFWNHLSSSFGSWIKEAQTKDNIEKILLRYTLSHLQEYLDKDDSGDYDEYHPSEFYIKDPINSKYTLEVSSPGLNRPLKSLRDFQRKLGNRVRIIYFEDERTQTIEGVIENIDQDRGVKINNGTDTISIALDKIRKAKIILKW